MVREATRGGGGKREMPKAEPTSGPATKRRRTQNGEGGPAGQTQEPAHRRRVPDVDSAAHSVFSHRVGSKWIGFPRWQNADTKPLVLKGALKRCQHVLKELLKRKGGQFFQGPVDPVKEGLPDYYQVVKDPVDLGTIQKSLDLGFYSHEYGGLPAHKRLAQDVDQVWKNALAYNPAGNLVSESAKELKAYADEQFEKISAEEWDSGGSPAVGPSRHLVMDKYFFIDEHGRTILPELLHQRGTAGISVHGALVPVVPDGDAAQALNSMFSANVGAIHYELVDNKDATEVQVWIKSTSAWVLLLHPAPSWSVHANNWLFNQLACEVAKKYIVENSHNLQYDKLLRGVVKVTSSKVNSKMDDSRVRRALVDCAEYLAACLEQLAQADGAKLNHKECAKIVRKLLAEAERDRAHNMLETLKNLSPKGSTAKSGTDSKEALAVCGALCGAVSKVEFDATRLIIGSASKETKSNTRRDTADHKRTPAKSPGPHHGPSKSGPVVEESEDAAGDHTMAEAEPEKQGYWERDDDGNRRWVEITPAAGKGKKRKAGEEGDGLAPLKRAKQILRDSPLVPQEGGLAKVLFDDQTWYVGRLTTFVDGKWHIVFADGDEDDVALPDPDVVLLPPVSLLVQALDEVCDEVKQGVKNVASSVPSLADKVDEIKKAVSMMRRNLKECLNRTTTGKSKEGEGSIQEVRDNFLKRVKARVVVTDALLTEKQWNEVVESANALAKQLDGPDKPEKPTKGRGSAAAAAAATDSAVKASRKTPKAGKSAADHTSQVKTPKTEDIKIETPLKHEEDTADETSGKKPGKRGRTPKAALAAAAAAAASAEEGEVQSKATRTPSAKASASETPTTKASTDRLSGASSRKAKRQAAEQEAEGAVKSEADTPMSEAGGEEWKDCPPWLHMNANIEVQWGSDWWKAMAVTYEKGKVLCNYVGGNDETEWVEVSSGRIRPPEDEFDASSISVGDVIEVRRPNEKKTRKWHLARIIEIDLEENQVLVHYLQRYDVEDEWLPMETKLVRTAAEKLDMEGSPESGKPAGKEGGKRAKGNSKPWPTGIPLEGGHDSEVVGTCLMLAQFLRSFGKSSCLSGAAKWGEKWSNITVETLISDVAAGEPSDHIVALITSLLHIVVQRDDKEGTPLSIVPDSLTWPAWMLRLLDKDVRERGKRILRERLEESFMPEEALSDSKINRGMLYSIKIKEKKSNAVQEQEVTNPYDPFDNLSVSVHGTGAFAGLNIKGDTYASAEWGVRVSCCGVDMSVNDFARFATTGNDSPKHIRVLNSEHHKTLLDIEAATRLKCEGEEEVNWPKALEQLLGAELFSSERTVLKDLGSDEWAKLSLAARSNVLNLLCDLAMESEALRAVLLSSAGDDKVKPVKQDKPPPSSVRLQVAQTQVAPPTPDPAAEAKAAEEARKEALSAPFRYEPIGWDSRRRRYWSFPWSGGNFAVELPRLPRTRGTPYLKHGSNRCSPFDPLPDWAFYTDEHVAALEVYLKESDDPLENKLYKRIKAEREAIEQRKLAKEAAEQEAARLASIQAAMPQQPMLGLGLTTDHPGVARLVPPTPVMPGMPTAMGVPQQPYPMGMPGMTMANGLLALNNQLFAEPLDHFPPRGEYLAKEDETPIMIAERFGIDVNTLCKMNEDMYKGLHPRARFKNGTLLLLPTPTIVSLGRSVVRPAHQVLKDLVAVIKIDFSVFPVSYRVHFALAAFLDAAQPANLTPSGLADAIITLEHTLLLPTIPGLVPHPNDRLLPKDWVLKRRNGWMEELISSSTLSQVALSLQEFHAIALGGLRRVRDLAVTRWMYKNEITKAATMFRRDAGEVQPLLMPDKGDHIVYLKQGHILHLEHFPQRVWDCMPESSMCFCAVESTWSFKLRPIPQEKHLVGHKIILTSLPANPAVHLPQACQVVEYQDKEDAVRQHLLRFDSGDADLWVCLDEAKLQLANPNEGGRAFFVTLHCQQKLPDFILQPSVVRDSLKPWTEGTRVRMWFWNEDGVTGSYYTGQVLEQKMGDDPWDSVRVQWDSEEGAAGEAAAESSSDWVCPWELRRWEGPAAARGNRTTLPVKDPQVITNAAEAAALPDAGYYITEEDETPKQVAAAKNVDIDLLVLINKAEYSSLTKLSKLLKGTRLRLPPQGFRFERPAVQGMSQDLDAARNAANSAPLPDVKMREFPKEDETWWDSAWTDEMQLACTNIMRKVKRNRSSTDFLEPVDHVALGLDDYLEIVKQPMDLSTIESKLEGGTYTEPKQLLEDVRLMLDNAMLYNPEGHPAHRNAIQLWNFFEDTWREEKKGRRRSTQPPNKFGNWADGSPP